MTGVGELAGTSGYYHHLLTFELVTFGTLGSILSAFCKYDLHSLQEIDRLQLLGVYRPQRHKFVSCFKNKTVYSSSMICFPFTVTDKKKPFLDSFSLR